MRTHCVNGHEWTTENVGHSTKGAYCRACARSSYHRNKDQRNRKWRQMQRQWYFDAVLPAYKACADLAQGGAE